MAEKQLLEINELTKNFGGVTAVYRCSFSVNSHTICGLIGPNGSGKSTIFNMISGIYRPDHGRIRFDDKILNGLKSSSIAQLGIGRTFQQIRIFPKLSAMKNMLAASYGESRKNSERKAMELLGHAELSNVKDELAGNLSYGEQKLLEFSRVLMLNPRLILLDEPACGIAPALLSKIISEIKKLKDKGKTIIVVEHDMKVIMNLCDKIVVLDQGAKIAEGAPGEIQNNEKVIEAYFGQQTDFRT